MSLKLNSYCLSRPCPSDIAAFSFPIPTPFHSVVLLIALGLVAPAVLARRRMPPGPNAIPILGNLGFPKKYRVPFKEYADKYGDVMTFRAMGIPVLMVNSRHAAAELFERRAASTYARPYQTMCDELSGLGVEHTRTNDMDVHRHYRRLFHLIVFSQVPPRLVPRGRVQEARRYLQGACRNHSGHDIRRGQTAHGRRNGQALPGCDIDPGPGGWEVREVRRAYQSVVVVRYPYCRLGHLNGCNSFLHCGNGHLSRGSAKGPGGTRPSHWKASVADHSRPRDSPIQLRPDIRDPSVREPLSLLSFPFDDQAPRWQPVSVFALPHAMVQDEIYDVYVFPKGTVLLPSLWAMTRDERDFPNANEFIPERWLTKDGKMRADLPGRSIPFTFGFGLRICPDWHLAESNIFAAIIAILRSTTLSTPDRSKVKWQEHTGVQVPDDYEFLAEPRFAGAAEALRSSLVDSEEIA